MSWRLSISDAQGRYWLQQAHSAFAGLRKHPEMPGNLSHPTRCLVRPESPPTRSGSCSPARWRRYLQGKTPPPTVIVTTLVDPARLAQATNISVGWCPSLRCDARTVTHNTRPSHRGPMELYPVAKISTTPRPPPTRTQSPVLGRVVASTQPMTEGMPSSRATMAAWESGAPRSVTTAPARGRSGVRPTLVVTVTRISPGCNWPPS